MTSRGQRVAMIIVTLVTVSAPHWFVPTDDLYLHALHVLMRKLLVLPVLLAAAWFGLRGAAITAALATSLYLPHIVYQWSGRSIENLNQVGELASLWLVGLLAGILIAKEASARREAVESHRGALTALSAALAARETDTERHSERAMAMAERLGWEMHLSDEDLDQLMSAALLHDIGKIGTPDRILLGKEPLDAKARTLVRRHPETGRRILAAVPSLRQVAEIVYSHHERYDGTGYPRGLEGEEIPLLARIFSVVDAFDAMVSDRPYSAGMPIEAARHIIARESGKQFDPRAVNAFLDVPTREWTALLERSRRPDLQLSDQHLAVAPGDSV